MVFNEQELHDLADPSLPLHYKLMVYYKIAPDNRRDYLQSRIVNRNVHRRLERLLGPPELEERLQASEKFGLTFLPGAVNLLKGKVGSADLGAAADSDGFLGDFKEEFCKLVERTCLLFHSSAGECYQMSREHYDKYVEFLPWRRANRVRGIIAQKLKRTLYNLRQLDPADEKTAAALYSYEMVFEETFVDFWKLRLDRTQQFSLIDPNLSYTYLAHSPFFLDCLNVMDTDRQGFIFHLNVNSVAEYIRRDEQLYRDMLGILNPATKLGKLRPVVTNISASKKTNECSVSVRIPKRKSDHERELDRIRKAVVNGSNLIRDSSRRVDFFAEDCLALRLGKQKIKHIEQVFSQFDLGSRLKSKRLDAVQFRNFIDDAYLMIMQGRIPGVKDLERMYEGVLTYPAP